MNPKIGNDSWPSGALHLYFAKLTSSPSVFFSTLMAFALGSHVPMVVRVAIVSFGEDVTPSSIGNPPVFMTETLDTVKFLAIKGGADCVDVSKSFLVNPLPSEVLPLLSCF
ncbi:hypothetical protein V8G54_014372 [Vigna mungo]|uniref:Uncharacterized protein n=1 Tax=Vigna mungo TaxID=3915 RepID=A0AAQ3RXE3_VIGMU